MTVITCFKCGKYCIIRDTQYQDNSLNCQHKHYMYRHHQESIHGDLEEIEPIQKKPVPKGHPILSQTTR